MIKKQRVFVIINSYFIGDILLANPLVQNIKRLYPESIVVMLTSPALVDVAKYQEGVDDVVIWDRHGIHHGFMNMLKFAFSFPYKNIYAVFPMYSSDRPIILSFLLGAKYILGYKRKTISRLLRSKYKILPKPQNIQEQNINLLSGITKEELKDCRISYNIPEIDSSVINNLRAENNNYIVLCPKSSQLYKDLPNDFVYELISKIKSKVILIGKGEPSIELSKFLKDKYLDNLIDLIDKTSILESAKIISMSKACISVDTGMLHMSCALNKPTIGLFLNQFNEVYTPQEKIYPNLKLLLDATPDNVLSCLNSLTQLEPTI